MRVGLAGAGAHAAGTVIPAIQRSSIVELAAIASRSTSAAQDLARRFDSDWSTSINDLVERSDVDVLYVATSTGSHIDAVRLGLQAGKPVWSEKPLSTSLVDVVDVLDLASHLGIALREVDMFLHHPQWRTLKDLIESGDCGEVISVHAQFGFPHLDPGNFRYRPTDGGGALADAGFYPVAAACDILGVETEVVGAYESRQGAASVDVGGSALLASGMGDALVSWGFGRRYRSAVRVWFSDAWVELDRAFAKPHDLSTNVRILRQSNVEDVIEVPAADQFVLMLEAFASEGTSFAPEAASEILARTRVADGIREHFGVTETGDLS